MAEGEYQVPPPSLVANAIKPKPNGIFKRKPYNYNAKQGKGPAIVNRLGRLEMPRGSIMDRLKRLDVNAASP